MPPVHAEAETVDLEVGWQRRGEVRPSGFAALVARLNLRPTDEGAHPWFLLSGLFMVVGCALLSAAAHARQDELAPVLLILAVVTVYEVAVLGIGGWFVGKGRRGGGWRARREGRQLFGLLVVLTADLTFVYNELSVADLELGAWLAAAALVWGVVKLVVIGRVAGLRLEATGWAVVGAGLGLTFGGAVLARAVGGSGRLPEGFGHAVWWAAAALITAAMWALSDRRGRERAGGLRWLRGLVLLVPTVSAVWHVGAIHWMYRLPISAPHVAPVLLGLSVVLLFRVDRSAPAARRLAVACGYVGALAAAFGGDGWMWGEGTRWDLSFSPLRMWLIAAVVGYSWVWWRQRTLGLLVVWPVLGIAAALGHTPAAMAERAAWIADQAWRVLRLITPRTLWAWGVTVVTVAYVMLGVGAWTSARRPELRE
ncbi:MAG: hypothetical protein AAF333_19045 [Planctomycetota bacterium]